MNLHISLNRLNRSQLCKWLYLKFFYFKNYYKIRVGVAQEFYDVCCKIKMDKVAKGIPHFCSDKFPTIAKGH